MVGSAGLGFGLGLAAPESGGLSRAKPLRCCRASLGWLLFRFQGETNAEAVPGIDGVDGQGQVDHFFVGELLKQGLELRLGCATLR
jgi:hypothetical protein